MCTFREIRSDNGKTVYVSQSSGGQGKTDESPGAIRIISSTLLSVITSLQRTSSTILLLVSM